MSRFSYLLRTGLGLGAAVAIASCGDADSKLLLPVNPAGGALFSSYVAIGNSLTAGVQSGGINDSTQRQSYAFLLAQQAGTRFAYPSFNKFGYPAPLAGVSGGCSAPLANWRTQNPTDSLVPAPLRQPCLLRDATKFTDILNNVGVPYSYAADLLVSGPGLMYPQPPQVFILGGKSQIERAIMADPTFVSVFIGNNETLLPASAGILTGYQAPAGSNGVAPPPIPAVPTGAAFKTAFDAAMDSLKRAAPTIRGGIMISAIKVSNAPRFFPADSLVIGPNAAQRRADIGTFTGKGAPTIAGCGAPGVTGWLISVELITRIRDGSFPANVIACNPLAAGSKGAGDIFVLDPTEIAALDAATDSYNAAISAKAAEFDWAYLDLNPLLAPLHATGAIPAVPNFLSSTRDAATAPFGALFSLDGAHPSAAGQKVIANAVIGAINTRYSLQIPLVP
jgi:lysophospholipase L1-like esterase